MLPSLAFVTEDKVIQSFTALMVEFPTTAIKIAEYFEDVLILEEYCLVIPEEFHHFP